MKRRGFLRLFSKTVLATAIAVNIAMPEFLLHTDVTKKRFDTSEAVVIIHRIVDPKIAAMVSEENIIWHMIRKD
jgi:hypothetical protein